MVRVMVIDDHPMWRDAVARDLAEAGYEVVATASDGAQALRLTGAARPDVVVLDPQLPDMSGVDVTRGLRAADPDVRVLVLSASGERQDVLDAPKAGVAGYLLKSAMRAEFLERCGARPTVTRCSHPGWPRWCSANSAGWPPRPRRAVITVTFGDPVEAPGHSPAAVTGQARDGVLALVAPR
jgi:DNA-binding response OmpR family regulator